MLMQIHAARLFSFYVESTVQIYMAANAPKRPFDMGSCYGPNQSFSKILRYENVQKIIINVTTEPNEKKVVENNPISTRKIELGASFITHG